MTSKRPDQSVDIDAECVVLNCNALWDTEITLRRVADDQDFVIRLCGDCAKYLQDKIKEDVN